MFLLDFCFLKYLNSAPKVKSKFNFFKIQKMPEKSGKILKNSQFECEHLQYFFHIFFEYYSHFLMIFKVIIKLIHSNKMTKNR